MAAAPPPYSPRDARQQWKGFHLFAEIPEPEGLRVVGDHHVERAIGIGVEFGQHCDRIRCIGEVERIED